jgi:hypothetical protein
LGEGEAEGESAGQEGDRVALRRCGEGKRAWGSGGREKFGGANEEAEENAPDCDWLMRIGGKLEYLDVWLEWY